MTADDPTKRLGRLKAMQAKHQARDAAPVQAPAAAPARAKPAAKAAAAKTAAPADSPRSAMIQKLRQHLAGDDGKIDSQKARAFLMFVKKQSADPQAPRHDMAKRIAEMIKALPQPQRQKLLAAAGLGKPNPGQTQKPKPQPQTNQPEDWFDSLVDKL